MLYNMVDLLSVAYKNNFALDPIMLRTVSLLKQLFTQQKLKMHQQLFRFILTRSIWWATISLPMSDKQLIVRAYQWPFMWTMGQH